MSVLEITMTNRQEDDLLIEAEADEESVPQTHRLEFMQYPADYTLRVLFDKWERGQLLIPNYQRGFVWSHTQASRLVESFLLGLPIPQIFLFQPYSGHTLEVVDGQQRLSTIAQFLSGDSPKWGKFPLRGVMAIWDGRTYSDLTLEDQQTLDDAVLRSIIIRPVQREDASSIYSIFERLNTGGTQLSAMEIRRAVCSKEAYAFLDRLNCNSDWRGILGTSQPHPRLRDVELVLRVLSLTDRWRDYKKPMKSFMTSYMGHIDTLDQNSLTELEQSFGRTCELVKVSLGERPFHLRSQLNAAALDSVMVACGGSREISEEQLAEAFGRLREDEEFRQLVTHTTGTETAVRQRMELVGALLEQ